MRPRRVGSGTATGEANACARILAALFNGGSAALKTAQSEFLIAATRRRQTGAGGGRGYSAAEVTSLLSKVPAALGRSNAPAVACGKGDAADVLVRPDGIPAIRIEIKAQTTLADFSWTQSADWIRGPTDFLGALLSQEEQWRNQLPNFVRGPVMGPYQPVDGWNLASLWVADVAGLTNRGSRDRLGVLSSSDLPWFLANKYLVQLTQEGLRMIRFSEIPNLTAALTTGVGYKFLGPRKGSCLTVWTRGDGRVPLRGEIHFTYYLGQKRRDLGGHHLHEAFFDNAKPVLQVPRGN